MPEILRWNEFQSKTKLEEFKDIFFESALKKTFSNNEERKIFLDSWTKYYLDECTNDLWVAVSESQKLLGYLTGCQDSSRAAVQLQKGISSYNVFEDLFAEFPAHLHINFAPEARGQGLGSKLISTFQNDVNKPVHIVTSPNARNVNFYRKNGFQFEVIRAFADYELLFMVAGFNIKK